MPTLAQALGRAKEAVSRVYGTGHDGLIRVAVEAALSEPSETVSEPKPASGWSGIRDGTPEGDHPGPGNASEAAETLRDVLATFKEGKDGHWRAHVGSGEYQGWVQAAGGPE